MRFRVLESNIEYDTFFRRIGEVVDCDPVTEIDDYDVLVLTGGSDVNPHIYGDVPIPQTSPPNENRDRREWIATEMAFDTNKPVIGICRGSQFLNVINGGQLIQHVTGHTQNHPIFLKGGGICWATSTHHQMMVPTQHAELLAYAYGRSSAYMTGGNVEVNEEEISRQEPEIVYYPHTRSLCIQPHPEYMQSKDMLVGYVYSLINERFST